MSFFAPDELGPGGRKLWEAICEEHYLDAVQQVQLLEACRCKDRLDKFDKLLSGDIETWATIQVYDDRDDVLVINQAIDKANTTANLLKQLLAAIRLPDATTGKVPKSVGQRGVYKPGGGAVAVSSLDRARRSKSS